MFRFLTKKLPSFQGVAPGATATLNIPLGLTYHRIMIGLRSGASAPGTLHSAASWGTAFGEIRVNIDGRNKIRAHAADLAAMMKYHGLELSDGYLPVVFDRPWFQTAQAQDILGYGTADVQSLTLEVDIAAGVVVQDLDAYAICSPNAALGQHLALRKYSVNATGAGEIEVSNLPRNRSRMMAAHLKTDAIDGVEVIANNAEVLKSRRELMAAFAKEFEKTMQTGWTTIDHCVEGRIGTSQPMTLQDHRFRLDYTGASASITVYVENIEGEEPAAPAPSQA